jgi:hypothetical protein
MLHLPAVSAICSLLVLPLAPAFAQAPQPKLGPDAVPLTLDTSYFRTAPAADYWAFSPFVKPQFTTSACSIASVTAAVNGLAGLPARAEDEVLTQPALLDLTGIPEWAALSAEDGDGVTFAQLVEFSTAALKARDLPHQVTQFKPSTNDAATLDDLRARLVANEASANDVALIYFNQGVITGDWDGPHVSLIGAYDAASDRVLILEVDQEWYIPYWTPTPVLLQAMLKPTSAEHGVLEGETGGLVLISP